MPSGKLRQRTGGNIEFKKTSKLNHNLKKLRAVEVNDMDVDKPQLRCSKLLMPEYVIDAGTCSTNNVLIVSSSAAKEPIQ